MSKRARHRRDALAMFAHLLDTLPPDFIPAGVLIAGMRIGNDPAPPDGMISVDLIVTGGCKFHGCDDETRSYALTAMADAYRRYLESSAYGDFAMVLRNSDAEEVH